MKTRTFIIFWEAAECSSSQSNYSDIETNQHMQMSPALIAEGFPPQGKSLVFKDQEKHESFSWDDWGEDYAFNLVMFISMLKRASSALGRH